MKFSVCGRLTHDDSRFYSAAIVSALQHIHSKDILFRDLKPENCCVAANGYLKLVDFGLAKKVQVHHISDRPLE